MIDLILLLIVVPVGILSLIAFVTLAFVVVRLWQSPVVVLGVTLAE